jgi:hypothetical protein
LPKQNRPLVRDGRLQVKKKRTDRSYLGATPEPRVDEPALDEEAELESEAAVSAAPADEAELKATPEPASAGAAVAAATTARRMPSSARALQQQGVRRRRELDVDALAERDSRYAMHELRRILILASIIVVTLIVLGIVLR